MTIVKLRTIKNHNNGLSLDHFSTVLQFEITIKINIKSVSGFYINFKDNKILCIF